MHVMRTELYGGRDVPIGGGLLYRCCLQIIVLLKIMSQVLVDGGLKFQSTVLYIIRESVLLGLHSMFILLVGTKLTLIRKLALSCLH